MSTKQQLPCTVKLQSSSRVTIHANRLILLFLCCPLAKIKRYFSSVNTKSPDCLWSDDTQSVRSHTYKPGKGTEYLLRTQAPLVFINRVTPPPLSHLLVLTAAHCFEFITVSRLLHSLLPPSLSSPSVVPVLSPRKGQSHLQSYSLPESHRTRVRERKGETEDISDSTTAYKLSV